MTKNDGADPRQRLRPNRNDRHHDQLLLREVSTINDQTTRALGLLPPGGLPVIPERKPQLPHPAVPPMVQLPSSTEEDTTMQWKSMAAVAVLATGGALTACGAEGTTARVDLPTVAAPDGPVPIPSATVDAVPPAAQAGVAEPLTPADFKASEPVRGPAIPAAQLRRQILMLLRSFEKLEHLERDNVERAFEVRFTRRQGVNQGYEYDGITSEGWQYGISTTKLSRLDKPSTIIVGMDYGFDYSNDLPPTYCTLEFESLAQELVVMGYERDTSISKLAGKPSWGFGRDSKADNAGFGISIYIYELEAMDGTKQTCIKGFRIGGGAING